jgi:ATP-binding cassette subfamily F protein 3
VHRVIEVADRKIKAYEGNYNDYLEKRFRGETGLKDGDSGTAEAASPKKSPAAGKQSREQRRSEAERRDAFNRLKRPFETRIRALEQEIETWESRKRDMETRLADPKTYSQGAAVGQLQRDYAGAEKELARLYAEWELAHGEMEALIGEHRQDSGGS